MLHRITARFAKTGAERLLVIGIVTATAFAASFVIVASHERVLTIANGVGFLRNYGLFAAIFGDAVLLYLAKRYFDCCKDVASLAQFGKNREVRNERLELSKDLFLRNANRFLIFLFITLGSIAVVSNISIHAFGNSVKYWNGDVFDSLNHPFSFLLNKLFSLYSWCFLLPLCGFVALISTIRLSKMVAAIGKDPDISYDLLHADNAGGFSSVRYAVAYFNVGMTVLYLQITLYTVTFGGINASESIAYVITTSALLFANFVVFGGVDRTIAIKRDAELNKVKSKAYDGEAIYLEIFRYYLDVFSRRALQRRLSFVTLTLKSAAIALPPIIKGVYLLTA